MSKTKWLNKLPEVHWDRYTDDGLTCTIFGWIYRKDRQRDFVIMVFDNNEFQYFDTSSAKYSLEFAKRLGTGHIDCQRVESSYQFRNVNNMIKINSPLRRKI